MLIICYYSTGTVPLKYGPETWWYMGPYLVWSLKASYDASKPDPRTNFLRQVSDYSFRAKKLWTPIPHVVLLAIFWENTVMVKKKHQKHRAKKSCPHGLPGNDNINIYIYVYHYISYYALVAFWYFRDGRDRICRATNWTSSWVESPKNVVRSSETKVVIMPGVLTECCQIRVDIPYVGVLLWHLAMLTKILNPMLQCCRPALI